HIEQLALRIRKIGVLRFKEFVTLLEFVVLVYRLEVHRSHVVQLCSKVGDKFLRIWRGELRRAWRRRACPELVEGSSALQFLVALYLCSQRLFKRRCVGCELAKIDLVTAGNVPEEIVDLHLELRFPDLCLCAPVL